MKKKVLFIDRDGTIIREPADHQIDSLEKLVFIPYAISALKTLSDAGFELVMVTNQDGLGTDSFPEPDFRIPQEKMLELLRGEGVVFSEIFVDSHFAHEKSPYRKPEIGMILPYLKKNQIDFENSYVIGDRKTDVKLAENLGVKSISFKDEKSTDHKGLGDTPSLSISTETFDDWRKIRDALLYRDRKVSVHRKTAETDIEIELSLDGQGKYEIKTGLEFLNHMLEQFAKHGGFDLRLSTKGDLHIDEHHTVEDTAIALGEAFKKALGDKRGIARFGFVLPMDETLATCALDFSNRPYLVFDGEFKREKVGDLPTELVSHFFRSFAENAGLTLNMKIEGENEHHKIEAAFKSLGKAIQMAVARSGTALPSTKGVI